MVVAFDLLNFPIAAPLTAWHARLLPKATYGAALLLVRPGWETRVNALHGRLIAVLLDLAVQVPRVQLLAEMAGMGHRWRLSEHLSLIHI